MDPVSIATRYLGPGVKKSFDPNEVWFYCPNGCGEHLRVNEVRETYMCVICGFRDRYTPTETRRQMMADKQFVGCGSVHWFSLYFEDKPNKPLKPRSGLYLGPPPPIPEEKKAGGFPVLDYRMLLTEVFKAPGNSCSDVRRYLGERGFSQGYWEARGIRVPMGENPMGVLSADEIYQRVQLRTTKEQRVQYGFCYPDGKRARWIRSGRLLFPYVEKRMVVGLRSRSSLPMKTQDRYLWSPHAEASRRVYNRDVVEELARAGGLLSSGLKRVVITEGEKKAALPTLFGIPTLGIPGVGIAHQTVAEILVAQEIDEAIVLFDTERPINPAVENSARSLIETLTRFGVRAYRFELPETGRKEDIDGFILTYGPGALFGLLEEAGYTFRPNYRAMKG